LRAQEQHLEIIEAFKLCESRSDLRADILLGHEINLQVQLLQLCGCAGTDRRDFDSPQVPDIFVGFEKKSKKVATPFGLVKISQS